MSVKWLTVAEVAQELGKSEATIRRMAATGRLPAYQFSDRCYSVDARDLYAFIAKSAVGDGDESGQDSENTIQKTG